MGRHGPRALAEHGDAHHLDKTVVARVLRRTMTPAERTLWAALRGGRLGVRWRRQHVLRGFILDFYAPALGMAIELDGPVHDQQEAEDTQRDGALAELGLIVVHLPNRDVLHDPEAVVKHLRALITPLLPTMESPLR